MELKTSVLLWPLGAKLCIYFWTKIRRVCILPPNCFCSYLNEVTQLFWKACLWFWNTSFVRVADLRSDWEPVTGDEPPSLDRSLTDFRYYLDFYIQCPESSLSFLFSYYFPMVHNMYHHIMRKRRICGYRSDKEGLGRVWRLPTIKLDLQLELDEADVVDLHVVVVSLVRYDLLHGDVQWCGAVFDSVVQVKISQPDYGPENGTKLLVTILIVGKE